MIKLHAITRAIRAIRTRHSPRPEITITITQSPNGTYEITRKPWPPAIPENDNHTLGSGGLSILSIQVEVRQMLCDFEEEQARE